jgi:hypothetical protein
VYDGDDDDAYADYDYYIVEYVDVVACDDLAGDYDAEIMMMLMVMMMMMMIQRCETYARHSLYRSWWC